MPKTLQPGKLPPELLQELIASLPYYDSSLVIPPGIGRDAAGIKINGGLVAITTDPVTITSQNIGTYSVSININDVACLGCRPRWYSVNILLPEGSTEEQLRELWRDMTHELEKFNIQPIGGHTEVTSAVTRPVVIGQIIGQAMTGSLLNPANGNPGDKILLWQRIPIEGVAILARERHAELAHYFSPRELDSMVELLSDPGICVWPAVECIVPTEGLVSLHDPTEGGIANALYEIAAAAGCGVTVCGDTLPLLPEVKKLSKLLQFDPLGMIASGCLLIVARPDAVESLQAKLAEGPLCIIGELTAEKDYSITYQEQSTVLPRFRQDEITKALSATLYSSSRKY